MKVSVYITSYNQRRYLEQAIESVLGQSFKPYEIVIADDCSSDGSQELITAYASRYPGLVRTIYHEHNLGVSRTRADALAAVRGDYVTYVDGDDRFLPRKLEREAALLQGNRRAQLAFSNYYYITEDGSRTGVWAAGERPPEGDVFRQVIARDFPRRNLFRNELVEYRAWREIGFHDHNLHMYEDYEMRIRLTKELRAAYYDEPLAEYRRHCGGLSRLPATEHLTALQYILEKSRPLLDHLSTAERKDIHRKLGTWIAPIAYKAAVEEIRAGHRDTALQYWAESLRHGPRAQKIGPFALLLAANETSRLRGGFWRLLRRISHCGREHEE